jgi:glutamyl-tRNA reductase
MTHASQSQNHPPQQVWADMLAFLNQFRAAELERACQKLAGGAPAEQVLEQFARRLTNKFLHAPMQAINQAGAAERAELLLLMHRICRLPDAQE